MNTDIAVWLALAVILVLALVLRAAVYASAPKPFDGAGLVAEQGEIARNIVDHGSWFTVNRAAFDLVRNRQIKEHRLIDPATVDFARVDRTSSATPEVDQMPGVAVVLAGLWWATGTQTYTTIQWIQILLDTAMVFLVFWISLRLTHRTAIGLIAAFLYAIWPGAIVVAKRPMLDTWAGFFTIGCVAAFVWARDAPESRRRLALLGIITGVGLYFRPFVLFLPIALGLAAVTGRGWRHRLLWITVPTAIALAILAPWTVRNYYDFHRFIPTRTGLGQAVFEGTGQASSDAGAARYVHRHKRNAKYGSPTYDNLLLSHAVRGILDDPGAYLRLVARRARFLLPCLLAIFAWRWKRAALIPVAAAVATIVPYLFIGDDTRFYLPAAFAYFILIAMAAETMFSFLSRAYMARPGRS